MIRLSAVVLGLWLLTASVQGQQAPKAPTPGVAKTGSVDGRVFGIAKNGDLKAARMPTIYLLYEGQRNNHIEEHSADDQYQLISLKALQRRLDAKEKLLNNGSVGDEDLECRQALLDDDQTLADVMQWALDNKKAKQVRTTEGDEEGHFAMARIPIGYYRIVARGQAGASDAYWEIMRISVRAGSTTSVKLMTPGRSCLLVE